MSINGRRTDIPAIQVEMGLHRTYLDGTMFADVLSNSAGKVFELRQRERLDGSWISRVVFRDKYQRPTGYNGLGPARRCAGCHDQAGTDGGKNGYAAALVPGAGGVLSEELDWWGYER